MERKELHPEGWFIRIIGTGEIMKVKTFVYNDPKQKTYYITDNGKEYNYQECIEIKIPSIRDFNDVIQKYPNALKQSHCADIERKFSISEICLSYERAKKDYLLRELKSYKEKVRKLEQILDIE